MKSLLHLILAIVLSILCFSGCNAQKNMHALIETDHQIATSGPFGPQAKTHKDYEKVYFAWLHRLTVEEYAKRADTNNPLYPAVNDFLEDYCEKQTRNKMFQDGPALESKALELINKGVTDPLFISIYGRILSINHKRDEGLDWLLKSQKLLNDYPDVHKFYTAREIYRILRKQQNTSPEKKRALQDDCSNFLISAIQKGEFLQEESRIAYALAGTLRFETNREWHRLNQVFEKNQKIDPWLCAMFAGTDAVMVGWECRGSGYAYTVTEEGWKGLHANIEKADAYLRKACTIRPENPEAATLMITVSKVGKNKDGESMRFWFDRAVEAQADYIPAYDTLITFLLPRWGGSFEEMEQFGIECINTGRFDTDIPAFYLSALWNIAYYQNDGKNWKDVYHRPGVSENLDILFNGMLNEPRRKNDRDKILAQKTVCLMWQDDYRRAAKIFKSIKIKPDIRDGFCKMNITRNKKTWDIVESELRLYTGPHAGKLIDADQAAIAGDLTKATDIYKNLIEQYSLDRSLRDTLVKKLVVMHLDYDPKSPDYPPLYLAAVNNLLDLTQYLVSLGEPIDTRRKNGNTALITASSEGYLTMVSYLLEHGADVNARRSDGNTSLLLAVRQQHPEVVDLLISKGAHVNVLNSDHWSPLLIALSAGQSSIAEKLIDAGADIHETDKRGWTPLLQAIENTPPKIAEKLIHKGADINKVSNDHISPLHAAVHFNKPKTVRLLIEKGAHINAKTDYLMTSLHFALLKAQDEIVLALINNGADVNAVSTEGLIALNIALEKNRPELARALVAKGANVNIRNINGYTPLHGAIFMKNAQLVKLFLDKGADIHAKTPQGGSPLDLAREVKAPEIEKLLKKQI